MDARVDRYISASKIKMFNTCQYCFFLRYIIGLPQQDKPYFQIGRRVEAALVSALSGETIGDSYEEKLARAIYSHSGFQDLIREKTLCFQNQVDGLVGGVPVLGFTDLEGGDFVIDVKTSSAKWTMETVKANKYQAILYHILTGKPFYFVVVRKAKTPTLEDVQVIPVKISEEAIKDATKRVQLVWNAWTNDLLQRTHTGGRLCTFPGITINHE